MPSHLVYDVGLHNGDDTAFYLKQGHRVVAVEADPHLADEGRRRFAAEVADGRLTVLNVGVAEEDGEARFWVCEGFSEWNSFDPAVASRAGHTARAVTIPTRRFASIVAEHGTPHYLKVDIEGSDPLCLRGLTPQTRPRYVSVEAECGHDGVLATADDALENFRLLRGLGYARFKLVWQWSLAPLTLPPHPAHLLDGVANRLGHGGGPFRVARALGLGRAAAALRMRARLGRRHGWTFAEGASGPWGEDVPGPWMDADKAERTFRAYRARHFRKPGVSTFSFWCDWHATV